MLLQFLGRSGLDDVVDADVGEQIELVGLDADPLPRPIARDHRRARSGRSLAIDAARDGQRRGRRHIDREGWPF
jgi:hypothetical protein